MTTISDSNVGTSLRILTLTDGGVRCLSQLAILENIMIRLGSQMKSKAPEPYECFEIIAGSGWGAIIAIMLGRLRMTVAECKEWFQGLHIIRPSLTSQLLSKKKIVGAENIATEFRQLVELKTNDPNAIFHDERSGVKTIVLIGDIDNPGAPRRFCSWRGRTRADRVESPVWQVAQAVISDPASDAPLTIPHVSDKKAFRCMTAGLMDHNPTPEVLAEAWDQWGIDDVRIIINLADGDRADALDDNKSLLFSSSLSYYLSMMKLISAGALSSRRDAKLLTAQSRACGYVYFYFSALSGLESIYMDEFDKMADVLAKTALYITEAAVMDELSHCAEELHLAGSPPSSVTSRDSRKSLALRLNARHNEAAPQSSIGEPSGMQPEQCSDSDYHLYDTLSGSPTNFDSDAWFRDFENTKKLFATDYPARIKLAVLDTGIIAEHPGIRAKNWSPKQGGAQYYYDATKGPLSINTYHDPTDEVGHGTHIAGLILETAPSVELYVIRVFTSAKISPQEQADAPDVVARAIEFASDPAGLGVKIISMSFGFDHQHEAVAKAVEHAHNRHVLMFAAASNSGNRSDLPYPARDPKVFLVHCADGNGNKSIRNPHRIRLRDNFSILGQDVLSTWPSECDEQDIIQREGLGTWKRSSGSSIATPILASVCALILRFGMRWKGLIRGYERLETWAGIREILLDMATDDASRLFESSDGFSNVVPWRVLSYASHSDIMRSKFTIALARIKA